VAGRDSKQSSCSFSDHQPCTLPWSKMIGTSPFETRIRVEFHDEPLGRTRLEIRQWLPAHLAGPSNQGWFEALEKLDATLLHIQAAASGAEV
jgi:hypothetical protein